MNYKIISIGAISTILIFSLFSYFNNRPAVEQKSEPVSETAKTTEVLKILKDQEATGTKDKNINQPTENKKIMNAVFHTNKGDITIAFNPNTPKTVENFIKLAKDGYYNGTKFHRVIKGFMNQGGDPLTKDDTMEARWGTGGPGYTFADEIGAENHNLPGTLSMANAGPNTNGSQFFINVADNSFLDTKHTVFGSVTGGADVVMAINNVATGVADRPIDPVIIESVELK